LYDTEDKLILIVKGTTYAGTDLSKMKEEDIKISDSLTCEITLPQAEILQNVVNPSDIKVFLAEGYWKTNYDAVQKVKVEAVAELEKKAKDKKIIDKANEKAIAIMKNFMQSLGFKNIKVNIK
jgi:molybdopterin-guanine dinucleotide biosynthesis protein